MSQKTVPRTRNAAIASLLFFALIGMPVGAAGRADQAAAPSSTEPAAQAYPAPDTAAAAPATGITLRGVDLAQAAAVQVTGSVSGAHALVAKRHRDGRGVTLQPRAPFASGEKVTVRGIRVSGGRAGQYGFTVATPGSYPSLAASTRAASGPPYKTRPDLTPPLVRVTTPASGTARGLLLTNPGGAGVEIMDDKGQPVWYHGVRTPTVAGDLEKARYHGQDVLVWFEGTAPYGPGSYRGAWTMVNARYQKVATIRAANGMQADLHDIEITPAGRAYLVIYHPVQRDLRSFGGSATANVLELVIQEVDIASGDLLWEWHSLDAGHFPVSDTVFGVTADPVDYIHGNSVMTDTDGNLLVSARNISTAFKLNRSTGAVMWRLGGKRNQFRFTPASEPGPSAQHDVVRSSPGVISMFDNGVIRNSSRGVAYQVNETAHTAVRVRERKHVPNHISYAQGNYRQLSNGNSLVSWGISGLLTEYDSAGTVRFEARVTGGDYRTIREDWTGRPATSPAVVVQTHGTDNTVYASWNGETDIGSWEVLTGTTRSNLTTARTVPRDGFETSISVPNSAFVMVRARSAANTVLGSSPVVGVGPWFSQTSAPPAGAAYRPFVGDFTGGTGDDVVFYAPGSGADYVWTGAPGDTFVDTRLPSVGGDYHPLVGDFVGDAHDDIIWWTRRGTRGYLWKSNGASGFDSEYITIPNVVLARVLRHRSGPDEVLWYNPGHSADRIAGYRWSGGDRATDVGRSVQVNGGYRPIIGDFDGNGWADIMWYGPGSAPDQYWRLSGNPGAGSFGQVASSPVINGTYTPLVGRFSTGTDGRDDIVWYAPGSAADYLWEGTTEPAFAASAHPNTLSGSPVLLHGVRDHLYLHTASADGSIWVPNGHPDIVRGAGNRAFSAGYRPIAGDFENTGASEILWYAAGPDPERLFRRRLG